MKRGPCYIWKQVRFGCDIRKRFKMTPALDWATKGHDGLFIYLFIEIYNNRINIYLEYIFRENHLNIQIFFYMYDGKDSSSISRILSANIHSG